SVDGQKISKSLGNTIDPYALIKKYGTDALRYYLLREIPAYDDGDFSERRFKELYNADLANGLGNLVARVAKLAENTQYAIHNTQFKEIKELDEFRFNDSISSIWETIKTTDQYINDKKPWTLSGEELKKILEPAIQNIRTIATQLQPFLY
ncbi:MAG: Methionyl-tRNA synthetase, partial [Microgenomates group bacterium GW2011_GWC1_39_12]